MTLFKVPAVAKQLNCSESFVYEVIADGRLKHHRFGKGQGGIRVSDAQIAAFLADTERCGHPAAAAPAAPKYRHLK